MRRWLATKLWPDFERKERRFWHLWHQVDDVNKWCDGEARDAAQWLLDQDTNYARPLGATLQVRSTPWNISAFRDWVYKRRADVKPAPQPIGSPAAASDGGARS